MLNPTSEMAGRPRAVIPARRARSKRWFAVGLIGVTLLALVVWRLGFHRVARLNVVLITLDTTRADYLGCYGRASAHTPHLDRLARDGVLFTRCTTSSSLTLPSHSSIMTGTYPFVHGVRQNATYRLADSNVTLAEVLKSAGYRTGAVLAASVLDRPYGLDQGFEEYRDVTTATGHRAEKIVERRGNQVCDDAQAMLRTWGSKPFFLWVHFFDPHYPYESSRGATDPSARYEDEIAFMDTQIGRLWDELTRLGLERHTLVVLVGDHGEGLGEHGESYHGYFTYETTVHVPLVFAGMGMQGVGRQVTAQVRTIDVAPTILDLAGVRPLEHAQGTSLRSLITGTTSDLALTAYAEALEGRFQFGLSALRSLSDGKRKFVLAPHQELYQVATDLGEQHNVITQIPEVAEEMHGKLYRTITDAPPPPPVEETVPTISAADLARLTTLGYAGGRATTQVTEQAEVDWFEPRGGDPKDYVTAIDAYAQSIWTKSRGDFVSAEAQLRQVIAALPNAIRPRSDLAEVLQLAGRLGDAAAEAGQALALAPEDLTVRWRYAEVLLRQRRWPEAIEQLRAFLDRQPDDFEAHYNLGIALASVREFDEARKHLERALARQPSHTAVLYALGRVASQQRRYQEAIDAFTKVLAIDPQHAEARAELARVRQALGRP